MYEIAEPARPGGNEISIAYNNFARGGKKPRILGIDQQPVFTQLITPTRFAHSQAQRAIPDAIPHATACYRDPKSGDSRLVRLQDLSRYPELIAQGPVGRLVTKGILDRYLKMPTDDEVRLRRDLAWVDDLARIAS